jgi:hypothetical protein
MGHTGLARLPDAPNALPATLRSGELLMVDAALKDSKHLSRELEHRLRTGSFREIARFPTDPSRITKLDDFPARHETGNEAYDVILYGAQGE